MYAVIFIAEIKSLDTNYFATAKKLREIAIRKYGCQKFESASEDNQEIAISYWESLEQIRQWKQDPDHLQAQILGKEKWYISYSVQVVEVLREYAGDHD